MLSCSSSSGSSWFTPKDNFNQTKSIMHAESATEDAFIFFFVQGKAKH